MEQLYRGKDGKIYVADPDIVEIPSDLMKINRTSLIVPCENDDESPDVQIHGNKYKYFSSKKGVRGLVVTTLSPAITTDPEDLKKLGRGDDVVYLLPEEEEETQKEEIENGSN